VNFAPERVHGAHVDLTRGADEAGVVERLGRDIQ
jgi:hypothetical protein